MGGCARCGEPEDCVWAHGYDAGRCAACGQTYVDLRGSRRCPACFPAETTRDTVVPSHAFSDTARTYRIRVRPAGSGDQVALYRVANAATGRTLFDAALDTAESFLDDGQVRRGIAAFMRTLGGWTEVEA